MKRNTKTSLALCAGPLLAVAVSTTYESDVSFVWFCVKCSFALHLPLMTFLQLLR